MATLPALVRAAMSVVKSFAPRLTPQTAGAVVHSAPLSAAELGQLADALQTIHAQLIGGTAANMARALAADGNCAAKLITCLVVGTGWLCQPSELTEAQRRLAVEALAVVTGTTHALDASLRHSVPAAASAAAFARALLRTHTLQRLGCVCAGVTAYLQGLTAALEAPAAAQTAPQEASLRGCVKAVTMVPALINNLATLAHTATQGTLAPPPPPDLAGQREWRRQEVARRVYVSEFVYHLGASGVFEHLGRALVAAGLASAAAADAGDEDLQVALEIACPIAFNAMLCNVSCLVELCLAVSPEAAATVRGAMSGPCYRHLMLSAGLAALCWADGGPSHGLPEALLAGLPVLSSEQAISMTGVRDVRQMEQEGEPAWLCPKIFQVLAASLSTASTPLPLLPHVGPRAAVSLLLRVGSLALASFRAWGQEIEDGEAEEESYFLLGPPWSMGQVGILWTCLRNVDALLPSPASGGWAGIALEERWQLVVGAVEDLAPWLSEADQRTLAQLVAEPLVQGELASPEGSLPAAPCPTVAAALAAGVVSALDKLVRSAGGGRREANLLTQVLSFNGRTGMLLGRLFAYGQPAETASLLAAFATLLRRCKVPPSMCLPALHRDGGNWDPTLGVGLVTSLSMLYRGLGTVLVAATRSVSPAAPVSGAAAPAPHPALRRLTTALGASAVLWLPEQARLGREYMMRVSDPWAETSPHGSVAPSAAILTLLVEGALAWIELLPFLPESGASGAGSLAAESGAAGSGDGAGGSGGGPGGDGGGGWRRFLVEEVGAVSLLAAALRLAPRWRPVVDINGPGTTDWCMMRLITACAAVAVAAPEAVQRAARAAIRPPDRGSPSDGAQQMAAWPPWHFMDLTSKMVATPFDFSRLALTLGMVVVEWGRGGDVIAPQLSALRQGLRELMSQLYGCDVASAARALPALEEARAMLVQP